MLESFVVATVVASSAVYAVWQCISQRLRGRIAGLLLRHLSAPCLAPLASRLRAVQANPSGCGGCGGCGSAKAESQSLRFSPPNKRT